MCQRPVRTATYRGRRLRVRRIASDKSNIPLLLSPRIREGFGKAGDREMRRRTPARLYPSKGPKPGVRNPPSNLAAASGLGITMRGIGCLIRLTAPVGRKLAGASQCRVGVDCEASMKTLGSAGVSSVYRPLGPRGRRIEQIVSTGHATPPGFWHYELWDERVLVLSGAARCGSKRMRMREHSWLAITSYNRSVDCLPFQTGRAGPARSFSQCERYQKRG